MSPTDEQVEADIGDEHCLPCDFIVGPVRFLKGVKLETVRLAAARWYATAARAQPQEGPFMYGPAALARPAEGDEADGTLLADINKAANTAGTNAWIRDVLQRAHRVVRKSTSRPAQAEDGWKPIDDQAKSGDVVLIRKAPHGETYAAFYGLAEKTVGCGATKKFPWVFLDPTNGLNQIADAPNGVTEYRKLPIRSDIK